MFGSVATLTQSNLCQDLESGQLLCKLEGHSGAILSVEYSFTYSHCFVVSASWDHDLIRYDFDVSEASPIKKEEKQVSNASDPQKYPNSKWKRHQN